MELDKFKAKMKKLIEDGIDGDCWFYSIYDELHTFCHVDMENFNDCGEEWVMPGFEQKYDVINGVPVMWCACGGDWELPVALCIYIGEDDKPHVYVPMNGNVLNFKTKCAIGNCTDEDQESELAKLGINGKYDMKLMSEEFAKAVDGKRLKI